MPNAFGEKAVLELMDGAMIRAAERWRGLPVTDLGRRPLEAVQAEVDDEYHATISRPAASRPSQVSSNSGALTLELFAPRNRRPAAAVVDSWLGLLRCPTH